MGARHQERPNRQIAEADLHAAEARVFFADDAVQAEADEKHYDADSHHVKRQHRSGDDGDQEHRANRQHMSRGDRQQRLPYRAVILFLQS